MTELKRYAARLLQTTKRQLLDATGNPREDTLHKLRVSIKKVNALLDYLAYCFGAQPIRTKGLSKLFRRAGKIRSLQLVIPDLEQSVKYKSRKSRKLLARLNKRLIKRMNNFKKRYSHKAKRIFTPLLISVQDYLSGPQTKHPGQYFMMMKDEIIERINGPLSNPAKVHELRKKIKTLKYNLEFHEDENELNVIDPQQLNKWETILGDWHDAVDKAADIKMLQRKMKGTLKDKLRKLRKQYSLKASVILDNLKITLQQGQ